MEAREKTGMMDLKPLHPSGLLPALLAAVLLGACGDDEDAGSGDGRPPERPPASMVLQEPPAETTSIKEAVAGAEEGQHVAIEGRVQNFTGRRAQMVLYDASLVPCNERTADACPTPWDYCCEDPEEIRKARATVEFRRDGRLLAARLEGWKGLELLKRVVVTGTAHVDASRNLVVEADGIYISP